MGGSSSRLQPQQLEELQKRTHFDKKELQQWYKGFIRDCPAGSLGKTDFLRIYRQFFPFGDPVDYAELSFSVFDEDKNGRIDFLEFISSLSVATRGTLDEKLKWAFQLYDIDKDGKISRPELLIVISAIYKLAGNTIRLPSDEDTPEKRVAKLFNLMDQNGDDMIDIDEFRQGSAQDPTIIDAFALYNGLV